MLLPYRSPFQLIELIKIEVLTALPELVQSGDELNEELQESLVKN